MSSEQSSNDEKKERDRAELEISYAYFNKLLKFILLFAIIVVSGFIIYYAFNQDTGAVTLGILNEDRKSEDYPTVVYINQEVKFYITVDNDFPEEFTFNLKILKGDENTQLSSEGSSGAELYETIGPVSLQSEDEWISNQQVISFSSQGSKIIIVELWEVNASNEENFFSIIWMRVNVTA